MLPLSREGKEEANKLPIYNDWKWSRWDMKATGSWTKHLPTHYSNTTCAVSSCTEHRVKSECCLGFSTFHLLAFKPLHVLNVCVERKYFFIASYLFLALLESKSYVNAIAFMFQVEWLHKCLLLLKMRLFIFTINLH